MNVDLDFNQVKDLVMQCSGEDLAEISVDAFRGIDDDDNCFKVIKGVLDTELSHRCNADVYTSKENKELSDFLIKVSDLLMEGE